MQADSNLYIHNENSKSNISIGKSFIRETEEARKVRVLDEDLSYLKLMRPMDDTFMRNLFRRDILLAQLVVRIITGKNDLILTSCTTQADMKRATGARAICLDAYATDTLGQKYDIEIQRDNSGATPKRIRYHEAAISLENLAHGEDFEKLPNVFIIFITEKDYFGCGKPLYRIKNINITINEAFDDGVEIIYVNGQYIGDDPVGRLMHDFRCSDYREMYYSELADGTYYLKETEEGKKEMCQQMEELRNKGIAEGKLKEKVMTAFTLKKMGMEDVKIAEAVRERLEVVKDWLAGPAPASIK